MGAQRARCADISGHQRAHGLPDTDYPDEPGGLRWYELTAVLTGSIATGDCIGMSVTIYDPDQDPERTDAHGIVRVIREALSSKA